MSSRFDIVKSFFFCILLFLITPSRNFTKFSCTISAQLFVQKTAHFDFSVLMFYESSACCYISPHGFCFLQPNQCKYHFMTKRPGFETRRRHIFSWFEGRAFETQTYFLYQAHFLGWFNGPGFETQRRYIFLVQPPSLGGSKVTNEHGLKCSEHST